MVPYITIVPSRKIACQIIRPIIDSLFYSQKRIRPLARLSISEIYSFHLSQRALDNLREYSM